MLTPTMNTKEILQYLGGEAAFTYLAKAKELEKKGMKIVNFGIGQPDIPTFEHIINAAKEALDSRFTGYTETAGIYELREAIAEYLNNRYSSDVQPSEVIVAPGAKAALFLALSAYLREGDEVLVPEPSFPAYPEVAKFLGAKPIFIPLKWLGRERGFKLDLESIERAITPKTKMIVINNPHNPTGAVFSSDEVEWVMDLARRKKIIVLADEIYDHFIYDDLKFKSFLSFPDWRDYVLYVNGFSKTFSMTGWRLGYLIARKEVMPRLTVLAVNVYSCATSFVQKAAVVALKKSEEDVNKMIELFRKRRDLICSRLDEVRGFEVWPSKGAFYIFPNVGKVLNELNITVEEFVNRLLISKGVVVLPGTAFPETYGKNFIRLSFAVDFTSIEEGVKRIKEFVEELIR
ncbi:MAG: pyridoxal phosphate-dependent aminotransferase [Desulfurococcaceae archaeon]|nr:pyridoxal phosphate-dependent aminotransferase [Desulfurococcaceae archaeon]